MTKRQGKSGTIDVKALLAADEEFLRALVRTALQEVLEAEMTEALGAHHAICARAACRSTSINTTRFSFSRRWMSSAKPFELPAGF